MNLSKDSKQTLLGPLVVGIIFGVLGSVAVVGFDSEYGSNLYKGSSYSLTTIAIGHGILAFVGIASVVVLLLGVLPIALPRIVSKLIKSKKNNA